MAGLRRSLPLLVALVALSGCTPDGLAFRVDERVDITSPRDRETVRLPLTLRWDADGIDRPLFAVFVDRPPMRPGARFVEHDLAHLTTDTEVVIDEVGDPADGSDRHAATIVLIDRRTLRRIGESSFAVDFELEPEDAS